MEQNTLYVVGLIVFLFAFVLLVLGIIYLNKKYPDPKKKTDPIFKSFIIVGTILSLFVLIELLGGLERGWVQKHLIFFIIALILLFAFYTFVAYYGKRAWPFEKLYNKALKDIRIYYNARPYKGMAYFPGLLFHTTVESRETLATFGVPEKLTSAVDAMWIRVKGSIITTVLIILNIYNGHNVKMVLAPPISMIQKIMSQEPINVYEAALKEFEEGGEEVKQEEKK